jgi:hypothetical protein
MIDVYEHYRDEIFNERSIDEASPNQVRALRISYHTKSKRYSNYPELRYLNYCHAVPDWDSLAGQTKLEHFGCEYGYASPRERLVKLLGNSTGLIVLFIVDTALARNDSLDDIGRFENLCRLGLVRVGLKAFPTDICKLTKLEELSLDGNAIDLVPNELGHLKQLRSLSLANCQLSTFPVSIAALTELEVLDLRNNPLGEIPPGIEQLTKLRELNIANCDLKTLPESLARLPNIKSIQATGNNFQHLPADLKKLKSKLVVELKYKAMYDEAAREKWRTLGTKSAIFQDFAFKLMVVQELMYVKQTLQPAFDVRDFAQKHTARKIDLEGLEAYSVIPEVRAYFENLEIPLALLDDIEALEADGGDDIYAQLAPLWSGEDDYFEVQSAKDAKLFPNLKQVNSPFLSAKAKRQLKKSGIDTDTQY